MGVARLFLTNRALARLVVETRGALIDSRKEVKVGDRTRGGICNAPVVADLRGYRSGCDPRVGLGYVARDRRAPTARRPGSGRGGHSGQALQHGARTAPQA